METWARQPAIAFTEPPGRLVPAVGLAAADLERQIHAIESRPCRRLALESCDVKSSVGGMGDDAARRAAVADPPGEAPRIDPCEADEIARLEPGIEMLGGAPARRLADLGAEHQA